MTEDVRLDALRYEDEEEPRAPKARKAPSPDRPEGAWYYADPRMPE